METKHPEASRLDTPEVMLIRSRRRSTEVAMRHLVHMVLDDARSSQLAAQRMLELVGGDLRILQRARARLLHASLERTTPITERALATLDLALHCADHGAIPAGSNGCRPAQRDTHPVP